MTNHDTIPVGLALSGGGARCFAHVGTLLALEESGYSVAAVAASSSAAIISAIYCTVTDARELKRILLKADLVKLIDAEGGHGLFGHDGIRDLLAEHAAPTFELLTIPLAVPAVDIQRSELLVYGEGELASPVCASNAFPGLFNPVEYKGRFLMDGGIINNFPVDVIRTLTSAAVLAVDVRSPLDEPLKLDNPEPDSSIFERIGSLFGRKGTSTVDILMQAYKITQDRLTRVTMAMHPPDATVKPDLAHDLGPHSFGRIEEAIEVGYAATHRAIEAGQFHALDLNALNPVP